MRSSTRRVALALAFAVSLVALPAFATLAVDTTNSGTPAASQPAAPADAASRFRTLVQAPAGDVDQAYRTHAARLEVQSAASTALHGRIATLDSTGQALHAEWEAEIASIGADSLRRLSQVRLDSVRADHARQIASLRDAEAATAPALASLRDRTLALKHAMNAGAAAGLGSTATSIRTEATRLREETERAVVEADRALAGLAAGRARS